MKIVVPIKIELKQKMSEEAKKIDDNSYILKLNLRFKYFDKINKVFKKKVLDEMNSLKPHINKIEELDEGYNVYFSSIKILENISKTYKKKYFVDEIRSKKIMGRDKQKSKDLYRHFLSITILNLKRKQKIRIKGEVFELRDFRKKTLYLVDENGSRKSFLFSKIKDYISFKEL